VVLAAPQRRDVQKKSLIADERERGDVALARWLWIRGQKSIEPERLVFVDETGTTTNMAPRYGWGPRGERVVGSTPHGHWLTTTFVGGLTVNGFIAPYVMPCPMNRAIFEAWTEQALVPELPDRAIVVMDNLSAHKGPKVAADLKAAGGEVLYLPPYSPDLNPIEQAFAKLKHLLRSAKRRTTDDVWDQIGELLYRFKPSECTNYIANAGYRSI
jgi:transposase